MTLYQLDIIIVVRSNSKDHTEKLTSFILIIGLGDFSSDNLLHLTSLKRVYSPSFRIESHLVEIRFCQTELPQISSTSFDKIVWPSFLGIRNNWNKRRATGRKSWGKRKAGSSIFQISGMQTLPVGEHYFPYFYAKRLWCVFIYCISDVYFI